MAKCKLDPLAVWVLGILCIVGAYDNAPRILPCLGLSAD